MHRDEPRCLLTLSPADLAEYDAHLKGRDLSLSTRSFATADDAGDPFATTLAGVLAHQQPRGTA